MGNKSTKLAKESAKVALPRTNIGNPLPISSSENEVAKNAVETLSSTSTELNSDILKEISKWQATKKPASQTSNLRNFESVHVIRMKKENQLKALTDLGSPPGMLTEEKLHEFFKEFRDNSNPNIANIAVKFHLDQAIVHRMTNRSRLPVITKDFEEGELSIAHVWDR